MPKKQRSTHQTKTSPQSLRRGITNGKRPTYQRGRFLFAGSRFDILRLLMQPGHISKTVLNRLYIPAYILLGVAIIDKVFYGETLQQILPSNPYSLFLYHALFELPHIIASFFMLGDREYRTVYRTLIYKNISLALCAIPLVVYYPNLFYILYVIYTLYHVTKQQFGISKLSGLVETQLLHTLQYIFIAIGSLSLIATTYTVNSYLYLGALCILLGSVVAFFVSDTKNKGNTSVSRYVLSFTSSALLFALGYPLLGLIAMRIIHDITAFMFYSTHNYNRTRTHSNPIYTSLLTKHIHPYVLTPCLAVLINITYLYYLNFFKDTPLIHSALLIGGIALGIMHYNLESRVWKRGSLARNYVHLSE